MRKTDAERRAFLRTLKPRLVAIADAAAAKAGTIDEAELRDRVAVGRKEYQYEQVTEPHAARNS